MAAQSQTTLQIGVFRLSRRTVQFVLRPVVLGIIVWIAYLAPPLGAIGSSVGTLRAVAARLRFLNFRQYYRATRAASGQRADFFSDPDPLAYVAFGGRVDRVFRLLGRCGEERGPGGAARVPSGLARLSASFALAVLSR